MFKKISLFSFCFFLLLCLWEFFSYLTPHLLFILPPPSGIFQTLFELRTRFFFHTLCTFKEMLGGFIFATFAAFPLAWAMMHFKNSRYFLQPFFIIIQCVPMFALAPLMVIWFGWSYTAIVIPTALMIFFPLALNIYQGLCSTPSAFLEFFQANGATSLQILFKLRLPLALPHIFSGFRIASAIAGGGAIAGEWAGAQAGLGMLMLESKRNGDLEMTFGALFCLTFISLLLYTSMVSFEKILSPPWRGKLRFPKFLILKKTRAAVSLFLLFLFLFSCQKKTLNTTTLLLDWLPNPNHIPLYVGIENNYFEEEGIHLTIQKLHDTGDGISYLTSKQADLLISYLPDTLKACDRGAHLKIIGALIKEPLAGIIYRENLDIQNPQNLSGYTLGYCLGGADSHFLDFLLEKSQIKPKDRKNVSVDLISALGTHSVDFIYGGLWNIEPAQLRSLGINAKYFSVQELGIPNYYELIVLANSGTKESSSSFVTSFQHALKRSIEYCKKNPKSAFEIYKHYQPDKREKTFAWEEEAWESTYPLFAESQEIELEVVEPFALWMQEQGIISKPIDCKEIINN